MGLGLRSKYSCPWTICLQKVFYLAKNPFGLYFRKFHVKVRIGLTLSAGFLLELCKKRGEEPLVFGFFRIFSLKKELL